MDSILKNITKKDIITHPFPHIDIRNAFSKEIVNGMLRELPDKSLLKDVYQINSKDNLSAIPLRLE